MNYFPLILLTFCITVKIHGWDLDNLMCNEPALEETKVLKTEKYLFKAHKKEINHSTAKSMCTTRDTLVDVVPPPNQLYVPSKVMVKQCGGSAIGKNVCMATNKERKEFTVLGMDVYSDNKEMHAITLEIEEHIKCKVSCMTKKSDCSDKQDFMPDKCMCVCKKSEEIVCTNEMMWDPSSCKCVCHSRQQKCSTGLIWNNHHCRCVRK